MGSKKISTYIELWRAMEEESEKTNAERIGLSTLRLLFEGKSPHKEITFRPIARFFGVEIQSIVFYEQQDVSDSPVPCDDLFNGAGEGGGVAVDTDTCIVRAIFRKPATPDEQKDFDVTIKRIANSDIAQSFNIAFGWRK